MIAATPPVVGILEWLPFGTPLSRIEAVIHALETLGVRHLRTGVSWAEWVMPEGKAYYAALLRRLGEAGMAVLPCFCYTPPELGLAPACNAPPRRPELFAAFVSEVLEQHGPYLTDSYVELWNEPNDSTEWNSEWDSDYRLFHAMIAGASAAARAHGYRVALGGVARAEFSWFERYFAHGGPDLLDAVSFHGFPGTDTRDPALTWPQKVQQCQQILARHGAGALEIWLSEAGYSTFRRDDPERETKQVACFLDALAAPVQRLYWYSLFDLPHDRPTVREATTGYREPEGVDFGLLTAEGREKKLHRLWQQEGAGGLLRRARKHAT